MNSVSFMNDGSSTITDESDRVKRDMSNVFHLSVNMETRVVADAGPFTPATKS